MAILLNGVTSTGVGSAFADSELANPLAPQGLTISNVTVAVVYATAAPTAATVSLEGSIDGISWFSLGSTSAVSSTVAGFAAINTPCYFFRGNMSAYTAGSNTGVTVTAIGK